MIWQKTIPTPMRPYGARVGQLTRFGNIWLDIDLIAAVEFNPPDGCGCELSMRGDSDNTWHLSEEDALTLRTYLEQFEQLGKQVDNAAVGVQKGEK